MPATALAAVASPVSRTITTVRRRASHGRVRGSTGQANRASSAATPNSMPSPKVTRPEMALPVSATAPTTAGTIGRVTKRLRSSSRASSPAVRVPATTMVGRTPRTAIRYGEMAL